MDLVSSTLDKYLKHRFNGNGLLESSDPDGATQTGSDDIAMLVPNSTIDDSSAPKLIDQTHNSTPSQINNATNQTNSTSKNLKMTTLSANHTIENTEISKTNHNHEEQLTPKLEQNNMTTQNNMSNGFKNDNDCRLPTIHKINICNTQPCCVALRGDLNFLAAGFENSHIYLWKLNKDSSTPMIIESMFTMLAHSGSVYSIQFVNNNDLMLSCSEDTTIRLWCLTTKCNLIVFRGHNYPIWSLDIGSQGNLFASASMDATARLWQIDKITPIRIFCGHDSDVECVKFHPNEKYVATGSSDATVRLWSTSDGKMVRLMVGHQDPIISLSFLPSGKFLASASCDGVIKIWNLATNLVSNELSVPASFTISFSPEQKFVASCGVDKVLRLWQVDETNLIEKKKLDYRENSSNLIQSQFHRDNQLFVIGYLANDEKAK